MGYVFRLTTRVILYAPSHRQDNTYHGFCYTSRGALLEREIAQWVQPMKDRSDDPSHHERTLLSRRYISFRVCVGCQTKLVFVMCSYLNLHLICCYYNICFSSPSEFSIRIFMVNTAVMTIKKAIFSSIRRLDFGVNLMFSSYVIAYFPNIK